MIRQRGKYRRGKVLDLELMRKKLESGIYFDHAIDSVAGSLAEILHENGFIISKAEKENGVCLGSQSPLASHNSIVTTKGG